MWAKSPIACWEIYPIGYPEQTFGHAYHVMRTYVRSDGLRTNVRLSGTWPRATRPIPRRVPQPTETGRTFVRPMCLFVPLRYIVHTVSVRLRPNIGSTFPPLAPRMAPNGFRTVCATTAHNYARRPLRGKWRANGGIVARGIRVQIGRGTGAESRYFRSARRKRVAGTAWVRYGGGWSDRTTATRCGTERVAPVHGANAI